MELFTGWIQPVPASTNLSQKVLPSPLLPSGWSQPHAMATQMFLVCTMRARVWRLCVVLAREWEGHVCFGGGGAAGSSQYVGLPLFVAFSRGFQKLGPCGRPLQVGWGGGGGDIPT